MLAVFVGLTNACVFADYPKLDTTKATVVDDLSVLGFNGSIATPEYLFNTVVTNEMYDVSGTNRNYWTKDPYVERDNVRSAKPAGVGWTRLQRLSLDKR